MESRKTSGERQRLFQKLGPEREMQLYGRGLRRRLATMLEGDARRLNFAYSLLFTLPGTPVLWYGEEIGMGEHLGLEDRPSVRTPMQWSSDPNAGFSRAAGVVKPLVEAALPYLAWPPRERGPARGGKCARPHSPRSIAWPGGRS